MPRNVRPNRQDIDSKDAVVRLAEALREDLRLGRYHPRERLVESDLVARYGTTRSAARGALTALAAEGFVERIPHRGASVRALTVTEGIEFAEVRRELEALCARDAAIRADGAQKVAILGTVDEMHRAAGWNDVHAYRRASVAFHRAVVDASGHSIAARQLANIRVHNLQRHFPAAFEGAPLVESEDDHAEIAAAISAGDGGAAEAAMRVHLSHVVGLLESFRDRQT